MSALVDSLAVQRVGFYIFFVDCKLKLNKLKVFLVMSKDKDSYSFINVSSTFSSLSQTLQRQTSSAFPGTRKRLEDISQAVRQHARQLPNTLGQLPEALNNERTAFIKNKTFDRIPTHSTGKSIDRRRVFLLIVYTEPVTPWEGYGAYEPELKRRILGLSKDQRHFLLSPPQDTNFQFDMNAYRQSAVAALDSDPALQQMRFTLVPQQVSEDVFWANYFYRVTLVKQTVLEMPLEELQEQTKQEDVLFEYSEDTGEEDKKTKEPTHIEITERTKGKETSVENHPKDSASHPQNEYDGMEEWERELRMVAEDIS
ncbi:hypothetical protein BDF14DRAFT_1457161 [Spinellus fusiger]|nr:hypothetical protein BDF14DRAFT_1457161 [Spinellus fusiger]